MNCQSCNAEIDYRFLTNCAHCGGEVEGASVPQVSSRELVSLESSLTWTQCLVNVAYVLTTSTAGMIAGAVVVYVFAGMVYLALYPGPVTNSTECGRGMAVGMLSILFGAFLGVVGGSVFAAKHLPYKGCC